MNKIKDIFYDKSDIVVAILVLAIAAVLIVWRLGVILEYPKEHIGTENSDILTESPITEVDDKTDNQGIIVEGDDVSSGSEGESSEGEGQTEGNTQDNEGSVSGGEGSEGSEDEDNNSNVNDAEPSLWMDGKLTKTVTVDVEGNSATSAVKCLVDADLFDDYDEYKSICITLGLDDEKVSAGTFTFKKGTSKEKIAKSINWG